MKKVNRVFLDRIEDDIAVLYLDKEETFKIDLPLRFLPENIREGTTLRLTFEIDHKSNEATGKEVEDLRKSLLENNQK
jgi:hypothetical protein